MLLRYFFSAAFVCSVVFITGCGNSRRTDESQRPTEDSIVAETEDEAPEMETKEPDAVPRVENFSWDESPLKQPLSETEKAWTGSIVAEVTSYHINTGGVMFMNKSGSNDLVESTMDAIENDTRITDHCIWMELYNDHTGFWYSCMMMDEPRVTEKIDVLDNNKKVTTGVMFDWYVKDKMLCFRFEKELGFTWVKEKETHVLHTRYWTIALTSAKPKKSFKGKDIYPEYGYTSPISNTYDFYGEHFYGKPASYESAIMF